MAALANGALAHAFEMDNLTWPNTGVHPGATMAMPALAVAQERGIERARADRGRGRGQRGDDPGRPGDQAQQRGPRLSRAGHHRAVRLGGRGRAAAEVRRARRCRTRSASPARPRRGCWSSRKSGTGAMVKRLHLGRAAESGILAAQLAEQGFTGPGSVLEGPFGFLNVYCGEHDAAALTRGLGSEWATLRIMLKRFPVHITSHTSVQAIEDLKREHGYAGATWRPIHIAGNQKMATVNNIPSPADLMMAQYSLPFCVALAHHHDARDPASFNLRTFNDPAIRALASRVTITVAEEAKHGHTIASTVSVTLKDGRVLTRRVDSFKGTPEQPLDRDEMREKFLLLTRHCDGKAMARLFERLQNIEDEKSLDWIKVDAAKKRKAGRCSARRHGASRMKRIKAE